MPRPKKESVEKVPVPPQVPEPKANQDEVDGKILEELLGVHPKYWTWEGGIYIKLNAWKMAKDNYHGKFHAKRWENAKFK